MSIAATRVRSSYNKRNHAYTKTHYRTSKDSSKRNNWSNSGNLNPRTGKKATENEKSVQIAILLNGCFLYF